MPWKTTKLKFFGVAIRRRSLFALTLFFAVAAVPACSWALVALNANLTNGQKYLFDAGGFITALLAFRGWWLILRHNPVLFREEARVLLPGAVVLLLLAIWVGCTVEDTVIQPAKHHYVVPFALGGLLMVFLLVRCALLGQYPRRGDIVRGESGPRRGSRAPKPGATPSPLVVDEDDVDQPPESGDSTSNNSGA